METYITYFLFLHHLLPQPSPQKTIPQALMLIFCVIMLQPWPGDLPLLIVTSRNVTFAGGNSTKEETQWELDLGVVAFSFSFTVICLLILVQVVR